MFDPVLSLEVVDFVDDFGATAALLVSLLAAALVSFVVAALVVDAVVVAALVVAALGSLTAAALVSLTGAFAWDAAALALALVALEVGF